MNFRKIPAGQRKKQRGAGLLPLRLLPERLREIGLRRCADRAALYTREPQNKTEYHTHDHILVCLSSAPSNEKIIRTAARMAGAFRCGFTALFVETKEFQWKWPPVNYVTPILKIVGRPLPNRNTQIIATRAMDAQAAAKNTRRIISSLPFFINPHNFHQF